MKKHLTNLWELENNFLKIRWYNYTKWYLPFFICDNIDKKKKMMYNWCIFLVRVLI